MSTGKNSVDKQVVYVTPTVHGLACATSKEMLFPPPTSLVSVCVLVTVMLGSAIPPKHLKTASNVPAGADE